MEKVVLKSNEKKYNEKKKIQKVFQKVDEKNCKKNNPLNIFPRRPTQQKRENTWLLCCCFVCCHTTQIRLSLPRCYLLHYETFFKVSKIHNCLAVTRVVELNMSSFQPNPLV